MKFLFDCDNEELLPATFDLAEEIEKFCKDVKIAELMKSESDEAQEKSNMRKILFRLCKEYPKETGKIFDRLWILDEGEKAPNALITAAKVIVRKDAIDFFTSLLSLAQ